MPTDALPAGLAARQSRAARIERGSINEDARTVELAISSEEPVERSWGIEILGHNPGEPDLTFLESGGAPLLMDHNARDQVGVVERVSLGADRKLRATVRLGRGARAEEAWRDVADGIRRNVSVGYELLEVREESARQGKPRSFRAVRWRPLEVSFVAIPADQTVGVGRADGSPVQPSRGKPMETKNDSAEAEGLSAREREIIAIGRLAEMPDLATDAILRGSTVEAFRKQVLELRAARSRPLGFMPPDDLAAPQIKRTFKVQGWRGEMALPEDFKGTVVRMGDGNYCPILTPGDRLAAFLPDDDDAKAARELGFAGFVRALVNGTKTRLDQRVLGGASIGTGGAMVPTPLALDLIDRLRADAVLLELGARVVPMASATLRFARVTTDPVGTWRAENAAINESDPAFDNVTLAKKSWAVMTRFSRELLQDAPNTEIALQNMFARVGALALDTGGLVGAGGTAPQGIAGASGIQSVVMGANGAQLTNWVQPLNAVQLLEAANAGTISGMVMAPRTARTIYGWTDTTNQPLRPPPRLEGIPLRVTSAMPVNETQGTANNASSILLGDFREVMIGMGAEIEITAHPDRYAELGQIALIGFMRGDVQLQRPAAMARIQGIIP